MLEVKISVSEAQIYVRILVMDIVIVAMRVRVILLIVVRQQHLIPLSVRITMMDATAVQRHQMEPSVL